MEDQSQLDAASPPSRPIRKRRRVPLACSTCRDRKTRCDGGKPTCTTCNRKGIAGSCFYEDGLLQNQRNHKHIKGQIRRVEEEDVIQQQVKNVTPQFVYSPLSNAQESAIHGSVDALGTTSSTEHTSALYGGSSTIAFASCVEHATAPRDDPTSSVGPRSRSLEANHPKSRHGIHGLERLTHTTTSILLLPSRHLADQLLDCYWHFVHPLFPILQSSSFNKDYERLWNSLYQDTASTDHGTAVFNSTLNLMFALGCQFSPTIPPEDRSARADEFYQQSRKFISFDILDSMHLSLVQMFLLTGVYLQSTRYADRCWNVIGLAIRVAYGLGLHIEQKDAGVTVLDLELRRRIWHTCVLLDRLLAMTFGRPTMISRDETAIPTPLLIDDEYLVGNAILDQPTNQIPSLGLFVYSLELYDILDTVLTTFYLQQDGSLSMQQSKSSRSSVDLSDMLKLNVKLDDFQDNLPAYLRFERGESPPKTNELQINVLHCRFLYVRILLLRPLLFSQAKDYFSSQQKPKHVLRRTLQSQIGLQACALCLRSAHELIESLHDTLETPNRSSPWHSVYFAFAAAMILVTSRLCAINSQDTNEIILQAIWEKCMRVLVYHRPQVQSAVQAIAVLERSWAGAKVRANRSRGPTPADNAESSHAQANISSHSAKQQATATIPSSMPVSALAGVSSKPYQDMSEFNFEQAQTWDRSENAESLYGVNPPASFSIEPDGDRDQFGVDDEWFTQTFLELGWSDIVNEDGGGFFF